METTVICPGCGKSVVIPQDLDACFCAYCGGRVERPAPTPEGDTPRPPLDCAALAASLVALAVQDRPLAHQFSKDTYERLFRGHQAKLAPFLEQVDAALPGPGPQREQMVAQLADAWLDALVRLWQEKSRGKPPVPQYEDQHLMAIYTIPALRDLPQACGEELAVAVQAKWVERWPKHPIGLGNYEILSKGFQKKLCFITTAVCRRQGKPDDCYELTAFRHFRDRELLPTAEGAALVEEYYRIAPAIVASVELCWDSGEVYDRVYRDYLLPCLKRIESGDTEGCKQKYVEMVHYMEHTYLPS